MEPGAGGQREARQALVRLLRLAYAGELAAARAYAGHWRSVRDADQKAAIRRIMAEELEHRGRVGAILRALGHEPSRVRDAMMWCVGTAIAASCFVGGWYTPMYGAGRIERRNIWEYEAAARHAARAGLPEHAEDLIAMAEVEWDHERYFHDLVRAHPLHRRTRSWPDPKPRHELRASLEREVGPLLAPKAAPVGAAAPRQRPARLEVEA